MRLSQFLAGAASFSTAAAVLGFNYGATTSDGQTVRTQADFEKLFKAAKALAGTSGEFASARLYTMIQGGSSTNESTQAIQAAIDTDTSLLLGLWASGDYFAGELQALDSSLQTYKTDLTSRIIGISVGSEDVYRITTTGQAADPGASGATGTVLAGYIAQVKEVLAKNQVSGIKVGHVDTWTGWTDTTPAFAVSDLIAACDFLGMDAYPYFQDTMSNAVDQGKTLFDAALKATQQVGQGKEVWVTETGFPVSGKTSGAAVPSLDNAKTYWDQVGCPLFSSGTNTWWYTLEDTEVQTNPSFGIVNYSALDTPLFNLSCSGVSASSAASSTVASSTGASSVATTTSIFATGGGLSPTGAGNGIGHASITGTPSSIATASSGSGSGNGTTTATGSSGSGSGASGLSTTAKPIASGTTSSGIAQVTANAGSHIAGSMVGAMGALMAAVAAL